MPHPELANIKGGPKQKWNRLHREEIIDYYQKHGTEATMKEYCLTANTMIKLLRENRQPILPNNGDRAMDLAQIANERSLEVQRTVNDLKRDYGNFAELVSDRILDNFIIPLVKHGIGELPPELEQKEDTRLRLDDIKKLEQP